MKKVMVYMLLSLALFQEPSTLKGLELIDIAQFVEENEMTIDEWSVTIKEKNNAREILNDTVHHLAETYEETTEETKEAKIYYFEDTHNNDKIHVSYKVVVPESQMPGEIVATLSGNEWNDKLLQDYLKRLHVINKTYFTEKSHVYTCLSIDNSGIIKSDDFFEMVKDNFNLSHIKTQTDKIQNVRHKKMYYGYTQIWDEKLTITDEPMNLQVVIDGEGSAKQNIIIGTPILINEY